MSVSLLRLIPRPRSLTGRTRVMLFWQEPPETEEKQELFTSVAGKGGSEGAESGLQQAAASVPLIGTL